MKSYTVKDLMVPLSEYATVSEDATLYEAVLSLERAQENFEDKHTRYRHRAILVLDKKGKVVFLDVRQPKEYENAHIPGSKLIPIGELDKRLDELDPEAPTVVY